MSEIQLVIREAECDWSGSVRCDYAERAIAALCADPTTLTELEASFARFERPHPKCRPFGNLTQGLCDEPCDAGLVVIDLVARLIVSDNTYFSPSLQGKVQYHNGRGLTEKALPYHLANDWLLHFGSQGWLARAEERRREQATKPTIDARAVFYGLPLLTFIATETYKTFFQGRPTASGRRAVENAIRKMHVAWMMTPREDLGGASPREIAREHFDHLENELGDRVEHWITLRRRPPGIDASSFAYRFGGFGMHEMVVYYDLVRMLFRSCWQELSEIDLESDCADRPVPSAGPHGSATVWTIEEFVAVQVKRLAYLRDEWMETPQLRPYGGRTPKFVVHCDRARLPLLDCDHTESYDPDCPCCELMARFGEPILFALDSSAMELHYAFDLRHETLEAWEAEFEDALRCDFQDDEAWRQLDDLECAGPDSDEEDDEADYDEDEDDYDDEEDFEDDDLDDEDFSDIELGLISMFSRLNRRGDLSRALRQDADSDMGDSDMGDSDLDGDDSDDSDLDGDDQSESRYIPSSVRAMGIVSPLVELIADLNRTAFEALKDSDAGTIPPEARQAKSLIDQLSREFDNLHHVLASSSVSESLAQPALDRFVETLTSVAGTYPRLAAQCDSLATALSKIVDEVAGDDIPF